MSSNAIVRLRLRVSGGAMVLIASIAALLAGPAIPAAAQGARDGWKAGIAQAVITPSEPMWMAGYAARTAPADGKIHDLWIKVIALEAPDGTQAVILTSDLIGFSRPMYERLLAQLGESYDLGPEQVMLNSSHTHSGPVLSGSLEDIYPLDAEQQQQVVAYAKELEATIVTTIGKALAALEPADVWQGIGEATFAVNRRENGRDRVPNWGPDRAGTLKGPVDHKVPVLAITAPGARPSSDDGLRAVAFGYACHNTTLSFQKWCGDYAGFAQLAVERRHPETVALFHTGCGGDQNPLPRRDVRLCQQYGELLADAVDRVLADSGMRPVAPTLRLAYESIDLELGEFVTREELERDAEAQNYVGRYARRLLAQLDAGKPFQKAHPYPVQVWRLGDDVLWISLGGEVVVDFALRFRKYLGEQVWVTAYSNDVMAYIPSLRVLREGGYEGSTSMRAYGLPSLRWDESVEEDVVGAVLKLAEQLDWPIEVRQTSAKIGG